MSREPIRPRVAGANPRNKRCQQLNLMLTRYNAACAEGAFSAQLTFDSNLTAHSRVMARRLPDVFAKPTSPKPHRVQRHAATDSRGTEINFDNGMAYTMPQSGNSCALGTIHYAVKSYCEATIYSCADAGKFFHRFR